MIWYHRLRCACVKYLVTIVHGAYGWKKLLEVFRIFAGNILFKEYSLYAKGRK